MLEDQIKFWEGNTRYVRFSDDEQPSDDETSQSSILPPPRKVLKITHTKDDDTEDAVEIVAV